jgi:hypothetical protein
VDGLGGIKRLGVGIGERIPSTEAANWSVVVKGIRAGLVVSRAARLRTICFGPVATPSQGWLSADEAKLHATGAPDVIAAIAQLDFPFAILEGTQLEVSASFQALESCIIGIGGAHWHTLVGHRMCKAMDVGFASAA